MFHSIISGACRAHRNSSSSGMSLLHEVNVPTKKATFALGCFWAPDSYFGATKGVILTRVGFTGGSSNHVPSYRNLADHTEAIQLDYDPNEISYKQLLDIFWEIHDPTARMKKQYTSIIFYHDAEQKELAESTLKEQQGKYKNPIITTIESVKEFFNAEDYHQKYRLQQHPFLMENIQLRPKTEDLINSHLAARLNGYVVGCGGVKQFDEEVKKLGLTDKVAEYVRKLVVKYEGQGLFC